MRFRQSVAKRTFSRNPPGSARAGRMPSKNDRASTFYKRVSVLFWLASSLRDPLSTGLRLLLVVGAVYGLHLIENGRMFAGAKKNPGERPSSLISPQPAPTVLKPSPILLADAVRGKRSIVPQQNMSAVPHPPALSASRYTSQRYEATRKKVFGGCTGELELTGHELNFRCPGQVDLILPVAAIAKAHKDGVVLKSGEKYHFVITAHTKGQTEAIFISWLNRLPQIARISSF